MATVAKKATPAAIAVLRQATALRPKRKRASDGLLPSAAHLKASPTSDHNTGLAVDLTHDPKNGIDCAEIFEYLKTDKRVKYLIFNKKIWSRIQYGRPGQGYGLKTKATPKKEREQMKKFKLSAKQKAAFKSYLRAVLASAITLGLALAADLAPQYAIAIGAVFGPLAKWADKAEEDFGVGSK